MTRGGHPLQKTHVTYITYDKGATPIAKNIIVVDEQGNEYEATYPKRAKGLVKAGRARFVDENKICLACPPSELEDNDMSEEKLSMNYVLEQMEKIMAETEYLHKTIEAIRSIDPASGPGDITGQAKAEALATVVKCRETTNQKMLAMYEKMYDDLKPQVPTRKDKRDTVMDTLRMIQNTLCDVVPAMENPEGLDGTIEGLTNMLKIVCEKSEE